MRGFTLLETIIYIAILALLIGGGIAAAFYVIDSSGKNKSNIKTQAEGHFILRKIDWALTGSSQDLTLFVPPSGTCLSITKSGVTQFFTLIGSNLQLNNISCNALPDPTLNLNSSNVVIAPVGTTIFQLTGGTPNGVSTNFTVNGQKFTMTKYLRK